MNWFCRTCWRHGEVATDTEENMHTEAVSQHLKAINSEQIRNPGTLVGPMMRFDGSMHAPDLLLSETSHKFRVKREPSPELDFQ